MTQRGSPRALASAFAHLMPGHRAAKSEDTDPKAKGRRAEGDKPEDENEDPKAKKKAEEPDTEITDDDEGVDGDAKPDLDDVEDPDDSLDDDAEATPPGEDDSDPKVRKAATRARKAENARWSKVLGHRAAAGRVGAACNMLATQPRATARSIVGTLEALPTAAEPVAASGRGRLDDRMAARPQPKVGTDAKAPTPDGDFGAFAAATVKKVRG